MLRLARASRRLTTLAWVNLAPAEKGVRVPDAVASAALPASAAMLVGRTSTVLVDAIDSLATFETARSRVALSIQSSVFAGHFPANPILPGVVGLEMLVQTGAVLATQSFAFGRWNAVGTSNLESWALKPVNLHVHEVSDCRFRQPVRPGDVLQLHVRLDALHTRAPDAAQAQAQSIWQFVGVGIVRGVECLSASFTMHALADRPPPDDAPRDEAQQTADAWMADFLPNWR